MFRLYSSTEAYRHLPLRDALARIAEDGFDGAEVWIEHWWWSEMKPREVKQAAAELGLELTVHAAMRDVNLTSTNRGIRELSLQQIIESLAVASEMGAPVVTVHPGHLTTTKDDPEPGYWEHQIAAFRHIAQEAGRLGPRVGVETMERRPAEFMLTAEAVIRLLDTVDHPALGITLDVAHLYSLGDARAYATGLREIVNLHISDAAPGKMHLPIGEGAIDFAADVLRHVAASGYDGALVVEGTFPGANTEKSRRNLARMRVLRDEASH
ncbi:MAG: sugar phosphate isomerase/epimerase family protein [Thermomicrobiales bacterium]